MQSRKSFAISPLARWSCFLVLLAGAVIWAANSVLVRAGRMMTADTPAQAFSTAAPGTPLEAVVKIDRVAGQNLQCTLLEKVTETTFRRAPSGGASLSAA